MPWLSTLVTVAHGGKTCHSRRLRLRKRGERERKNDDGPAHRNSKETSNRERVACIFPVARYSHAAFINKSTFFSLCYTTLHIYTFFSFLLDLFTDHLRASKREATKAFTCQKPWKSHDIPRTIPRRLSNARNVRGINLGDT